MKRVFGFFLLIAVFTFNIHAQEQRGVGVSPKQNQSSEKRLALVIGNGTYQHTDTLANPVNDASDIAQALKKFGFEVIFGTNQTKQGMERTKKILTDELSCSAKQ
jgi:hypothetical protein